MAHSPALHWILFALLVPSAGCASRTTADEAGPNPPAPAVVDPPEPAPSAASADADRVTSPDLGLGLRVYRRHYCGLCHRFTRAGANGSYGPSHDGYPATAARRLRTGEYTGQAATAADYTRESILNPDAWVVTGYESTRFRMPGYTNLTHEELEALVRLLLAEEPPA